VRAETEENLLRCLWLAAPAFFLLARCDRKKTGGMGCAACLFLVRSDLRHDVGGGIERQRAERIGGALCSGEIVGGKLRT